MNQQLTDKTKVIMLKGGFKCYISDLQFEGLKAAIQTQKKSIFLDDYYFNSEAILFILPAADIERDDRIKRGDWICPKGSWHKKNEECQCSYIERMQEEYDKTQDRISESV